ncbi:MAG: divergent polysaccharide deacetylase family protein, partial [Rhodobacteraceae bacterium]|nr:divergent polysaccharide deacetylase family protein [Paracoccaceae bacterium]
AVDAGAATRAPNAAAAAFIPAAVAVPPAAQTAGSGAPEPEAAPQAEPAGTDALAGSEASSETRAAAADTLAYATADPVADPVSGTPTDVAATVEVAEDGASGAMTAAAPLADEGGATASSDTADAGDAAAASASDALQAADADVGADTAGAPLAVAAADPAPEPAPAEPLQTDAPAEASAEPLADAAEAPDPAVPPVAAASFGRPVTQGFGNRAESVRINRLPRIGEAGAEADALSEGTAASAETLALPDDAPALDRFAAEFENPEGRPLVAVVLIDIGAEAGGIGAEALATIPFPVTLAIPADAAGAADAAAAYRKAGFEVAMIPGNIPELASPSDVEVAFEVFRSAVSETVAVLEPLDAGFQSSRAQAEQVVAILDETGQGLISFDRGLNNALGAARRAGLPAITVSRDLDADGSDPEELRRSLDRAAFRAEQEGAAVVVLRSRPQSVSTLYAWALEGRAEGVALAPVSAVFRAAR